MMLLAAINWHSLMFLLFSLVACAFAVAVVTTSNIVRMAFYLTLCLGATSGLFFLAGAEFVGAMQLLIYVGGTLVLLIFGVMLTAQARFVSMKTSGAEWVLAAGVGSMLFLLLLQAAFSIESWNTPRTDVSTLALADGRTSTAIGLALTGVRVDQLDEPSERMRGGMSGYLFPFVIVSMHLLVVLIGAAYMARTKRLGPRAVLAPATIAAPRVRRPMGLAVKGGIVSGIVVNLALGILCLVYWLRHSVPPGAQETVNRAFEPLQPHLEHAASWLWPLLAALFFGSVLMLVVIYGWQRWGVIGLVLITIGQALAIGNSGLDPSIAWIFLVLAMAPVALLILLLNSGPRPTPWQQME
jgi:NADH-quinone oxidoreductase subunit J